VSGQAVRLFPKDRRQPTLDALEELRPLLRWWFIGTALSMAMVGTLFGAGYAMIGLQFAAPLALFAGVAQVVPTFGPMITLVLSLLVAIPQGSYQVGGVVVIYVVVQSVESYILTPKVMERAVHVPPVVTLFTIILWGNVFGVVGLILAIPLNLMIWALLKHHIILRHERTEPGQDDQPSTKPAETQET
jgi:predicted PurR-regulated permease PerM